MKWVWVFTATVIADYFWAKWSAHCAEGNPLRASWYSILILLCGGYTIVEYTANHWLLIPACIGAGVGTYLAVKPRAW